MKTQGQMESVGGAPGESWTAMILAGSRPTIDPLAQSHGVATKALVPVAGKPMLAHVLSTVLAEDAIKRVEILAQRPTMLTSHADLAYAKGHEKVSMVKSGSGIATSIADRLQDTAPNWPVLVTTADHVLLDAPMLTHFLKESRGCDVAIGFVSRAVLTTEFPRSRRTWLRFSDDTVTGANLFALRSPAVLSALQYWSRIEAHRKRPWSMAARLGPGLLLSVLLRRLSLDAALAQAGARLGITVRAVRLPFARAAVDVDCMADHALAERLLMETAA